MPSVWALIIASRYQTEEPLYDRQPKFPVGRVPGRAAYLLVVRLPSNRKK